MSNKAIQKLINVAEAEIGYLEKRSNSNLDSKTANSGYNNYKKYWRDETPIYQGSYWCAIFVDWCFSKAFGDDVAKKLLKHSPFINCGTISNLFTRHANPQVGDIVIFYKSGRGFYHTGIVVEVNGDKFKTIEGNTSGASGIVDNGGGVAKKTYYNSKLPGTKFLRPDYSIVGDIDLDVEDTKIDTEVKTVNIEMTVIKKGSKGNEVRTLQRLLIALGYSCGTNGADGDFGSATDKAVKAYQSAKKLTPDGIVGKATWTSVLKG